MRIKLDENLPEGLADLLRSAKYDVATALEENLGGAKDPVVTAAVKQEGRLFMTYDLDSRIFESTRQEATAASSFFDCRIRGGEFWKSRRAG
jgi:predicted nuclease of predicted toxin-antitoxin system